MTTLNEYSLRKTGKHFMELNEKQREEVHSAYKAQEALNFYFNPDLRIFG